ncbi:MAG: 5-(carboxyamino)imidazole ribonucleotide synthase [Saprospiraceae bacterium]|nr:5-(carboxyamino)imidazole ribonucleotide synthase [Saprospiraceae bacterium]
MIDFQHKRIGILGGGQLGKMLFQAGSPKHLSIHIMENVRDCPAYAVCPQFTIGDIKNFDDVLHFGRKMDIITIEIENINVEALEQLEAEGKEVYPQPSAIKIIKDKGLQKRFYDNYAIPTSPFHLYESASDIKKAIDNAEILYPFVQKLRKDGYDGKGVQLIHSADELNTLFDAPSVVENKVDIEAEISVIVARNKNKEITTFPPVQMEFHPTANLVEFLFSPSDISENILQDADNIAREIAERLDIVGLLAVEMFVTKEKEILVNEVAPRPHNSGHHTIEANYTSQYEQHLRCILGLPSGSTKAHHAAAMVNVLGAEGYSGQVKYLGMEDVLREEGAYIHLYGKTTTKPFRKMGHITIIGKDILHVKNKAENIFKNVKVISESK